MLLPMLLPSGVSVDNTTLEEHQKREATWGRPPNDPFTGVPFTSTSQPLPNPQLKSRIDHFLLQKGMMRREGVLGRQGEGENPQASRLITSTVDGHSQNSPCFSKSSINNTVIQYNAGTRNTNRITQIEDTGLGHSSDNRNYTSNSQPLTTDSKSELERRKKRDRSGISKESTEGSTAEKQLLPQTKRPRNDAVSGEYNMFGKSKILKHICYRFFLSDLSVVSIHHPSSVPSCSSHEQRLSASLDEALFSALQGRPSFTSNLSQQPRVAPDSEPPSTSQHCQTAGTPSMPPGRILKSPLSHA